MFTYTNFKEMKKDLKTSAELTANVMFDTSCLNEVFKKRLTDARIYAMKCLVAIPAEHRDINVEVSTTVLAKQIKGLPEDTRKAIWAYRNASIRVILLNSIVTNPKIRPSKLAHKTLAGVVKEILVNGRNEVTISQVIHNVPLNTVLVGKDSTPLPSDAWTVDEIRLQFINELCELDILDMRLTEKIHMISIPDTLTEHVAPAEWKRLAAIAAVVNKKTILTEPAPAETKGMITTSSWFYDTPYLSDLQVDFIDAMHNVKYQFVDDAEDLIEEAYREHLKVSKLEKWALNRVEFFKEQIRASHANGGHYIMGKFDSALRWYYMAEIGHFQTSSSLRKLVKVSTIQNPVKYDMKNNVVQMYAVSLGVKDLGKYVGLTDPREANDDLRSTIAKRMNEKCEMDVFNKDNIKPLFMVWAYNAGKKRILEGSATTEIDFFGNEVTKIRVPGLLELTGVADTEKNRDTLFNIWENILIELVPSIVALKKVFSRITRGNPLTTTQWTLPDGAIAQYASAETLSNVCYWVDSTGHRHQHTHHRKEIVENAKAAGLLPRAIHSLDAYMARKIVVTASTMGITVIPNHDSFMFDKQYVEKIYSIVKQLFIEVLEGDYLGSIVKELNKNNTSLVLKDTDGNTITADAFGERLTSADILAGNPMDTEEI